MKILRNEKGVEVIEVDSKAKYDVIQERRKNFLLRQELEEKIAELEERIKKLEEEGE
ncbi:MAG: nuclear fragile X mental retardation-interacting protein 1 [Bacteroidales bacterium]